MKARRYGGYPGKPGFENVRGWYPTRLTDRLFDTGRGDIPLRYQPQEIEKSNMTSESDKFMLFVRPGMESDLASISGLDGGTLIYSLWDGYRKQEKTRNFFRAIRKLGISVETLHTSGHADIPTLQRMEKKLRPKSIIPIHAFHPERYREVFSTPIAQSENGLHLL